jgi:hypothetical protein
MEIEMPLGRLNGYLELTFQRLPVRFHQGFRAGLDTAARGGFLPISEVWARAKRPLKA